MKHMVLVSRGDCGPKGCILCEATTFKTRGRSWWALTHRNKHRIRQSLRKRPTEMAIKNLPDKDFKVIVIKILTRL